VLFVPCWYPPASGQKSVSGEFVREHVLADSAFDDVGVLAFRADEQGASALRVGMRVDSGVEVIDVTVPTTLPRPLRTACRRILWLYFVFRAIARWGRPDLLHCQDRSIFYAAPAARLLGIPYVVSNHWTGFLRRALNPEEVAGFRRLLPGAAVILSSNLNARQDFDAYGIEGRVVWLPNSFDTKIFRPGSGKVADEVLVHVSGFTDQKRVPDILRAFGLVLGKRPGAKLLMIGDGCDRAAAESMAAELLPSGTYSFPGFLPKAAIADVLRRSRGFVFPSSAETFGCALMEAMACGCPVLTTRVGGIPAVAREGEALFVEVGDVPGIADAMLRFLGGTHGIDTAAVAEETGRRFGRSTVGEMIHRYHVCAVDGLLPERVRAACGNGARGSVEH